MLKQTYRLHSLDSFKILHFEDEEVILNILTSVLRNDEVYRFMYNENLDDNTFREYLDKENEIDLFIIDLCVGSSRDPFGLQLIPDILKKNSSDKVIIYTANHVYKDTCLRLGILEKNFYSKPVTANDHHKLLKNIINDKLFGFQDEVDLSDNLTIKKRLISLNKFDFNLYNSLHTFTRAFICKSMIKSNNCIIALDDLTFEFDIEEVEKSVHNKHGKNILIVQNKYLEIERVQFKFNSSEELVMSFEIFREASKIMESFQKDFSVKLFHKDFCITLLIQQLVNLYAENNLTSELAIEMLDQIDKKHFKDFLVCSIEEIFLKKSLQSLDTFMDIFCEYYEIKEINYCQVARHAPEATEIEVEVLRLRIHMKQVGRRKKYEFIKDEAEIYYMDKIDLLKELKIFKEFSTFKLIKYRKTSEDEGTIDASYYEPMILEDYNFMLYGKF